MHEAVVFWLLVAVVCGSFAAAEYMYLVEVFRICRSRTQSLPYKVLVVLVAIADGIVFLWGMSVGLDEYMYYLYVWGPSPNAGIAIGLVLSPIFSPLLFVAGVMGLASAEPSPLLPNPVVMALMLCLMLVAFSAQVVRPVVMYKSPRRSWWKIIFVFYVTYWPVAFLFDSMARR